MPHLQPLRLVMCKLITWRLANGNTITVGSGETNDFQDESGNSVLIVSDTKTEARNTLEVTYTSQYPTSDKFSASKITTQQSNLSAFRKTDGL